MKTILKGFKKLLNKLGLIGSEEVHTNKESLHDNLPENLATLIKIERHYDEIDAHLNALKEVRSTYDDHEGNYIVLSDKDVSNILRIPLQYIRYARKLRGEPSIETRTPGMEELKQLPFASAGHKVSYMFRDVNAMVKNGTAKYVAKLLYKKYIPTIIHGEELMTAEQVCKEYFITASSLANKRGSYISRLKEVQLTLDSPEEQIEKFVNSQRVKAPILRFYKFNDIIRYKRCHIEKAYKSHIAKTKQVI